MAWNGSSVEKDATYSGYYKMDGTCDIGFDGDMIAEEFVEVLKQAADEVEDKLDISCEIGATGCGSCGSTDEDAAFTWVAQNGNVDSTYIAYGHDNPEMAYILVSVAMRNNVDVSWDGDIGHCVCLGDSDAY